MANAKYMQYKKLYAPSDNVLNSYARDGWSIAHVSVASSYTGWETRITELIVMSRFVQE